MTKNEVLAARIAHKHACRSTQEQKPIWKTAITESVRDAGFEPDGMTLKQRVDAIYWQAELIHHLQLERRLRRAVDEPPSLAERLEQFRQQQFDAALRQVAFRRSESGLHRQTIVSSASPAEVRAEGGSERGRKRWNSWTYTLNSVHYFCIPLDWYSTVAKNGLAVLDGTLTLSARLLRETWDGISVYEAKWASQGRGFTLNNHQGFIARKRAVFAHADDPQRAAQCVRRHVRHGGSGRPRPQRRQLPLSREEQQWGDLTVTMQDALDFGLCEEGVLEWCEAVGLDPDQPTTLRRVVEGYRLRPASGARLFVRHVVRQARCYPPSGVAIRFNAEGAWTFSKN